MKIKKNKLIKLALGLSLMAIACACEKSDMPPSSIGDPVLFVRGSFKSKLIDLTIGKPGVTGTPYVYEDTSNVARVFSFTIVDSPSHINPTLNLSFISYSPLTIPLNTDIDSTFKPGEKGVADLFNSPSNPFQLNTFTLELSDNDGYYTSRKLFQDASYCRVDSVKDLTWHNGDLYKMVYLSFSCLMVKASNPQDSTGYFNFSNGKATLAFPKK